MNAKMFGAGPLLAGMLAVVLGGGPVSGQAQTGAASGAPDASSYSVVQRGPHSRVWQKATLFTDPSGVVRTNVQAYTELCSGLCYLQNGQYVDSVEQINLAGAGAEAVQGPCKVQWAADASTAGGAVKLTSPGGQQFSSRVYGLALRDVSTGSNVLIAQITNSTGVLVGRNQIVYPTAFSGLQADIQDDYRLSGFEQNVVLREQLPSPADYGLNPATTYFGVLTEFFNPPVPQKTTLEMNGVSDDMNLDFGDVGIGKGGAFLSPGASRPARVDVVKHWEQLDDGRVFLIEEVPYDAISNLLQALPLHAAAGKPDAKIRRTASLKSLLRQGDVLPKSTGAIKRVAQRKARQPGLVVDYTLLTGSLTNYLFQCDSTYYISGAVNMYGSPIFEGGVVVKYTNTATAGLVLLDHHSNYIFKTYPYRPAVFTSANDNAVGTSISGSTGSPSTGQATYLLVMNTTNSNVLIEHARFSYAGTGFCTEGYDISHIFKHCQFVQCATNVALWWDTAVTFENILSANSQLMLAGWEIAVNGEQMTVDSCSTFVVFQPGWWGYYSGGLTNCILTAVDNSITNFTLNHTAVVSSGTGVYQTAGAGGYYLANGSTNRGAGTTNIDPALQADLQSMTTYPPLVVAAGWFTNSATLCPQVQRDTLTPDLGFHYYSLDYAVNAALSNATVTVLPGTALAAYGLEYGICLYTNGILNCQGTATSPIYFVRYNTVQEQSNTNWESTTFPWDSSLLPPWEADTSSANFAFTDWCVLAADGQFIGLGGLATPVAFQNCQFYGGTVAPYGQAMWATNCLFQRVNTSVEDVNVAVAQTFYNNLFLDGELTMTHVNTDIYTFRDNLLDECVFTLGSFKGHQQQVDICSNNAYVTTNNGVVPPENNDIILTNSPAYQLGALGQYYYPTNLSLIHAGSQSAPAAGLYHFTVTTNNVVEGTNTVSIGFHYVAVGGNGLPLDTNGDGIPDYLEDANGNGLVDSGEIDWQVAGDLGLTVIITQPANNSTIP